MIVQNNLFRQSVSGHWAAAESVVVVLLPLVFVLSGHASEEPGARPMFEDGRTLWRTVIRQCGGGQGRVPRIVIAESPEFDQAAREVMKKRQAGVPDAQKASLRAVPAFYSPVRDTVYLRRDFVRLCPLAMTAGEISIVIRIILFHEFVHASQYRTLPVRNLEQETDAVVLDALLEGHARYCTERFASVQKGNGWSRVYARIAARYRMMAELSHSRGACGGDVSFFYVDGYEFIKAMAEAKPSLSIQDVFKRGLPTQRQIVFPDEYLKGFSPKMLDMTPVVAALAPQDENRAANAQETPIQFVDMRLMLYRSGFTKTGIEKACRNYRGGQRIEQPGQVSVVLAFAPTRHEFVPVYIRRCTSETLIKRDVRVKRGHRLKVPKAVAGTTDAWITPAWDEQRAQPAKAKDAKSLPPSMHAIFGGKYLYIRSEWKTAPKSDEEALKVLLPFVDRCRKADAECATFFKDESGDDEWD